MYKALSPGAIGVSVASLDDAIDKAKRHGFGGVEIDVHEVAGIVDRQGPEPIVSKFAQACLQPAGWGLPTDWRNSEENWTRDLAELPRLAKAAAAVGCTRTFTWILPFSNERSFAQNHAFHIERFKPIAEVLAEAGCSLGLEFIGPKTLREQGKHPFIYTLGDMIDLGAAIGPNVGLLLDAWHWYTSGGEIDDIEALTPNKVVYVHVNDAPKDVPVDHQIDNVRSLPGETGVIDIAGFLGSLKRIGYNGPITPEPFKKELNDLPDDDARLAAVAQSMDKIFGALA